MSLSLYLGAHMSIAGGVDRAVLRGSELGCTAIQMFLKYNTRWEGRPLMPEERRAFFANQKKTGIKKIVAHNCYLVNLASPDDSVYSKSMRAMQDEIERAALLRIPCLVIHPGSHKGSGESEGIARIASALNNLFSKTKGSRVKVLLETTSGQGTGIGHRFEQIAEIISQVKNRHRLGICLDTAHVFAAGYDIRTRKAYRETMREFDSVLGLNSIGVLHMNDSKKPLGSRIDRHEHIGKGHIGIDAFRFIMNDERLAAVPKILETPKGPEPDADVRNLNILRSLCDAHSPKME